MHPCYWDRERRARAKTFCFLPSTLSSIDPGSTKTPTVLSAVAQWPETARVFRHEENWPRVNAQRSPAAHSAGKHCEDGQFGRPRVRGESVCLRFCFSVSLIRSTLSVECQWLKKKKNYSECKVQISPKTPTVERYWTYVFFFPFCTHTYTHQSVMNVKNEQRAPCRCCCLNYSSICCRSMNYPQCLSLLLQQTNFFSFRRWIDSRHHGSHDLFFIFTFFDMSWGGGFALSKAKQSLGKVQRIQGVVTKPGVPLEERCGFFFFLVMVFIFFASFNCVS